MNNIICIAGPTASGKSALAVELAKEYHGEVVSCDSMQVYRRMDIGTAKPTREEMQGIPHHMIDVAEPDEDFSVSRYCRLAAPIVDDIVSRGKTAIIVGGTGLYIDSLISGRSFAARDEDENVRAALYERYDSEGGAAMLDALRKIDPERAARLAPGDRRRIVRALEIYAVTGQTATAHDAATRAIPPRYDAARIVLGFARREALYARIDARVDKMIKDGLFDEVEALLSRGVGAECTAMQAIGYKEAVRALRGEMSRAEAAELIKLNSRRYAKRQMTWFRRWEDALRIDWEDAPDFERARRVSTEFLHSRGIS